jgi:hypothetical protein
MVCYRASFTFSFAIYGIPAFFQILTLNGGDVGHLALRAPDKHVRNCVWKVLPQPAGSRLRSVTN